MVHIKGLRWDEEAEDHIARQGVVSWEVEEALANIRYAKRSRGYFQVIGQTEAGRYLTVILDEEDDGFLVSGHGVARDRDGEAAIKGVACRKRNPP